MLIAEELEVPLARCGSNTRRPTETLCQSAARGASQPGNSHAIRGSWKPLRQAGAAARSMLVAAAARHWEVDPATCRAEDGEVIHARPAGSSPMARSPPKRPHAGAGAEVPLKPRKIQADRHAGEAARHPGQGQRHGRFGIDASPPGVKFAAMATRRCSAAGSSAWTTRGARVKGVRQVVRLDDAVAVVADHMGAAKKGLERSSQWDAARMPSSPAARSGPARQASPARARWRRRSAMSPRGGRAPAGRSRPTECRSSPMRRWSR